MFGSAQLQGMLLAFIPAKFGKLYATNIMSVDMFVNSLIVTAIVSFLNLFGRQIKKVIETDPYCNAENRPISVKVDYYRMDRYNEPIVNIHYTALSWLVSTRAQDVTTGDFRMVPYEDQNGADEDDVPDFNILPRDDAPLAIEYEEKKYLVWFDLPPAEDEHKDDNNNNSSSYNRLPKKEPSIFITRDTEEAQLCVIPHPPSGSKTQSAKDAKAQQDAADLAAMKELLAAITKEFLAQEETKKQRARYERSSSYWRWVQNLHANRGLKSVALDKLQEELLYRDLETFHKDHAFYTRMGIPWRRGYLFSGAPGTGKTSLINAISATYNRDLYYVNLKEVSDDNSLQSLFSSVPKNSIIVFEDVDAQSPVVHSRERRIALRQYMKSISVKNETEKEKKKKKKNKNDEIDGDEEDEDNDDDDDSSTSTPSSPGMSPQELADEVDSTAGMLDGEAGPGAFGGKFGGFGGLGLSAMMAGGGRDLFGGITLSTLLNCLDGHTLAEGIIIIMTSNHPEVLDPALIRPGRIDLHLSLGYCTLYQLKSMYRSVLDDENAEPDFSSVPERALAPCDAMRIMLLYRHEPEQIPIKLAERAHQIMKAQQHNQGDKNDWMRMPMELK
ncbi:hypothetical protein HK102_001866 [Quaeritorhiza haematococci]|nr:hypothetical protein HK102_001866 [Quaeritorhiza haematococci]